MITDLTFFTNDMSSGALQTPYESKMGEATKVEGIKLYLTHEECTTKSDDLSRPGSPATFC